MNIFSVVHCNFLFYFVETTRHGGPWRPEGPFDDVSAVPEGNMVEYCTPKSHIIHMIYNEIPLLDQNK